jgi:hypothetical protein
MLVGVGAFKFSTLSGSALLLLKRGTRFKSLVVQWLSRTKCFVSKCTAVIILWSEWSVFVRPVSKLRFQNWIRYGNYLSPLPAVLCCSAVALLW